MKKCYVGCAVLALLLLGSLWHARHLERRVDALLDTVNEACRLAGAGDCDAGAERLRSALGDWEELERYAELFVRHSALDETSEAFYALLGDLCAGDDGSAQGSGAALAWALEKLSDMERPRLGSVF